MPSSPWTMDVSTIRKPTVTQPMSNFSTDFHASTRYLLPHRMYLAHIPPQSSAAYQCYSAFVNWGFQPPLSRKMDGLNMTHLGTHWMFYSLVAVLLLNLGVVAWLSRQPIVGANARIWDGLILMIGCGQV